MRWIDANEVGSAGFLSVVARGVSPALDRRRSHTTGGVLFGVAVVALAAGCRLEGTHSSPPEEAPPPDVFEPKDAPLLVDMGSAGLDASVVETDTGPFPRDRPLADLAPLEDVPELDGGPEGPVRQVATGWGMTCAIVANGNVYCWGISHALNRLGTQSEMLRPRRVGGLRQIEQLAISSGGACAVDTHHAAWCWGENWFRDLSGSTESYLTSAFRRPDVSDVRQVAMYAYLTRHGDGSLLGRNGDRLERFSLPAPVVDIDGDSLAGYCAVLSTGQVACYEDGPYSQGPRLVPGVADVIAVAVGYSASGIGIAGGHFCALKRDGTVWCWGHNERGQTGIQPEMGDVCPGPGRVDAQATYYYCLRQPRQVPGLTDVVQVSAGYHSTCALRRDRTVWCWGTNTGIGGAPTPSEQCPWPRWDPRHLTPSPGFCRPRPAQVPGLTEVTFVSVGGDGDATCAVRSSGELWCWGGLSYGDGTERGSDTPVLVEWSTLRRDE